MKSPALAIAWSILARHRATLVISVASLLTIALSFPILAMVLPADTVAAAAAVPLVGIFVAVLNALLFAEDAGSLSSRYPRHMLTLPVRTRTLALWPAFFASSGAGFLWLAADLLVYRSNGYHPPLVVPALAFAAVIAWAQALAWLPIASFWFRELLNIGVLAGLAALPLWLTYSGRGSFAIVVAILIAYILSAFAMAWAAVASDRCGVSWRLWPASRRLVRGADRSVTGRAHRPFRSPMVAQRWYEWNCHALMLNGFVGVILVMIWAVLFARGQHGNPQWLELIFILLAIVVVTVIAASGPTFGRFRPFWTHYRNLGAGINTFVLTRPMTTYELVAAKFQLAAKSVLANWALAVAGTTFWVIVSGNLDNAAVVLREFASRFPGGRAYAILGLACILLPALSWRMLTGSLVPVLSGRRWAADGAVWSYLTLLTGVGVFGFWIANDHARLARFYTLAPGLVVTLAALKAAGAMAAFRAVTKKGLMLWQDIIGVLGLWLFLTGCCVAMAILVQPISSVPISSTVQALSLALFVPLLRFPLATLALDWNRHR